MKSLVYISCLLVVGLEFVSADVFGMYYWNDVGEPLGLSLVKDVAESEESLLAEVFWRIYLTSRTPERMLPGKDKSPMPTEIPAHKILGIFALSLSDAEYLEIHTSFEGGQLTDNRKAGFVYNDPTLADARTIAEDFDDKVREAVKKFQKDNKEKLSGLQRVCGFNDLKKIGPKDNSVAQKLYVVVLVIGYA